MHQRLEVISPRSAVQVLAATSRFVGAHLRPLLGVVGILAGPLLFISSLAFVWFQGLVSDAESVEELFAAMQELAGDPSYFVLLLTAVLAQFVLISSVTVALVLYVETDEMPNLRETWERLSRELGTLAGTFLGLGLIAVLLFSLNLVPCLGNIAFVVAALYFGSVWSPVFYVRLWEGLGFIRALGRCLELVGPHVPGTLVVVLGGVLVYLAGTIAFSVPGALLTQGLAASSLTADLLAALFSAIASLWFVYPLLAVGLNFFSLIAKERRSSADADQGSRDSDSEAERTLENESTGSLGSD